VNFSPGLRFAYPGDGDAVFTFVTTGLDPVVHADLQQSTPPEVLHEPHRGMDCRIKPGKTN